MALTSGAAANCGKEIARGAPRGSVLVVDDDEDQQQLNASLTQAGYGVQLAGSAEVAFATLASRAGALPDVAIIDVLMPGINGFEACRRIRSDARMLDLPVVLVTALNSREERVTREACAAREMARMSDTGRLVISMAGAK